MNLKVKQKIPLKIKRMGINGEGIGFYQKTLVFVPGALKGEDIYCQITSIKRNFVEAKLLKVNKKSKFRVVPACTIYNECGGCQIMHLYYDKQLEFKTDLLHQALKKFAPAGYENYEIRPTIGMQEPKYYRAKLQFQTRKFKNQVKAGLYAQNSHYLVELKDCLVQDKETQVIANREQIDLLRSYNLDFEIVPGVSSFCAAAACLDAEYTLPNVSQSVIITRMEGRTPVPNKQKIADYAAHKATMVIFLSSGMLEKLQKELIAGGYTADTPAAIVYKASWPDEKVCRCTVGTLAETAKEHNITKTALITVGNFLGNIYDRSELYNPTFAHGYRAADPSKLDLKPEVK